MTAQFEGEHVVAARSVAVRQIHQGRNHHGRDVEHDNRADEPLWYELHFVPELQPLFFPPQADETHPLVPRTGYLILSVHCLPLCRRIYSAARSTFRFCKLTVPPATAPG